MPFESIYQYGAPILMSEYIFFEIDERHTTFGLKLKQVCSNMYSTTKTAKTSAHLTGM